MIDLRVQPDGAKRIRISGIEPYMVNCLLSLLETLEQADSSPARERLYPNPTRHDDNANAEWQQLVAPELRHLFVTASETVARDLTGLQPDTHNPALSEVAFPTEHVNAWMSALNQARLVLAETVGITEEDMNVSNFKVLDKKAFAVVKIHLLGHLLQLFVELVSGEPEKFTDEPEASL
jgi:hypothetical protein